MELKSVKTQSNRFKNRLNQIENRFAHLEGRQNRPARRKDDDYYYDPNYPNDY